MQRLLRLFLPGLICLSAAMVPISGCQFWPYPSEGMLSSETAGTAESSYMTTVTDPAATQTAALPVTEPTGESGTTDAPGDFSQLPNTKTGWYFVRPASLNQGIPAAIPASIQSLVDGYGAIWQAAPSAGGEEPAICLTMDEGYEFENDTVQILDIAADKNVRITFFITGSYLEHNPSLIKRMVDEGHLVANHTWGHPNMPALLDQEGSPGILTQLSRLEEAFKNLTGRDLARYVRLPEGSYSERLLAILDAAGYRTVFWSFAYRDWVTDEQPDRQEAFDRVAGELHDGSVILLHAVSATNVAILPSLIDEARNRGYRFTRLDALP